MNIIRKIKGRLGIPIYAKSETEKVMHLCLPYCRGYGCDVGFGGFKIKPDAVGIDLPQPYTKVGKYKVDIACDLSKEKIPVPDNTYDYVYSSHLIEDFEDTTAILKEFCRVLKSGGNLILVFPDQLVYERYCFLKGEAPNPHHVHSNMGLGFMKGSFHELYKSHRIDSELLFESYCDVDYNCILIVKIYK